MPRFFHARKLRKDDLLPRQESRVNPMEACLESTLPGNPDSLTGIQKEPTGAQACWKTT